MKLTFIGNGNMAKALIKGLIDNYEIEVLGRNEKTLKELNNEINGIEVKTISNNENIDNKNIILCVKQNSIKDLSTKLSGEADTLFSVLAGTSLNALKSNIKSKKYIRTMPNLGATYLKSMTTITGDEELKNKAIEIFNKIGKTLWVNSEKELDIATGVAGSGPAFLALVAESLADGAVNQGLKRGDAQILVQGLFEGFAELIKNSNPADIKDGVMSPAGTTASGYYALEKGGVRFAMMEAIKKAYEKSEELKG